MLSDRWRERVEAVAGPHESNCEGLEWMGRCDCARTDRWLAILALIEEVERDARKPETMPEHFALCETTQFTGRDEDDWFLLEWWGEPIGWAVYKSPPGCSLYSDDSGPNEEEIRALAQSKEKTDGE